MRENSNRNPNRFRDMFGKNPDSVIEQRRRFCNRVATTRIYPYSAFKRYLQIVVAAALLLHQQMGKVVSPLAARAFAFVPNWFVQQNQK